MSQSVSQTATRIVIIGGGPAGYEAALVAAQLGASVTVVERDGLGGACVLYDCVPSKTFIASSDASTAFKNGDALGVMACEPEDVRINAPAVHGRVKGLALAQSADVRSKMAHGRRRGRRRPGPAGRGRHRGPAAPGPGRAERRRRVHGRR